MADVSLYPNLLPSPPPDEHREAAAVALDALIKDHAAASSNLRTPSGLDAIIYDRAAANSNPQLPSRRSPWAVYFQSLLKRDCIENFGSTWHLGNHVLNRATGERTFEPMPIYVRLGMYFLYYGSKQQQVLHWKSVQDMLAQQSQQMGTAYDSPQSKDHIEPFIKQFNLHDSLKDLVEPDPKKYATFNEFFARQIKPSARPLAEPSDPLVVSSPADCRLTAFQTFGLATEFWIKGCGFTIGKLLGNESLALPFDGGSICIARLAPQDYHRWHAPIDGRVEHIHEVPGTYYTVNPMAVTQPGTLNVFCENRRSVMIMTRPSTDCPVAIVAVGAMLVGSIKYEPGIKQGSIVKRGQCLGSFQYGGSTVIVIFPKQQVKFDTDLVQNSTLQMCETLMEVGWRIGKGPY
jgi:phosphatidylserine decarboxylase